MFNSEEIFGIFGYRQRQKQQELTKEGTKELKAMQHSLRKLERARRIEERKPKCPWCGGSCEKGFDRCKNCSELIIWVGSYHGKPDQYEQLKQQHERDLLAEKEREQQSQREREAEEQRLADKKQRASLRRKLVFNGLMSIILFPASRIYSLRNNSIAISAKLNVPLSAILLVYLIFGALIVLGTSVLIPNLNIVQGLVIVAAFAVTLSGIGLHYIRHRPDSSVFSTTQMLLDVGFIIGLVLVVSGLKYVIMIS